MTPTPNESPNHHKSTPNETERQRAARTPQENRYPRAAVFPLYILFSWFFDNWFVGGAFAIAIVYVVGHAHALYARTLTARIEAADSPTWDVEVNQVKAGNISDADYAAIRMRVFYDFRVYVSQVMNLLRVALNCAPRKRRPQPAAVGS